MKFFISSLIRDFGAYRDAAERAVNALGHDALRAESLGASPDTPQRTCLALVRQADATVLILGSDYGEVQRSGLSATHEEYREARDRGPVLAFVEADAVPDARQAELTREVREWEGGSLTVDFSDAEDLRDKVSRAVHDVIVATEATPLDEKALVERAESLIPVQRFSGGGQLVLAAAAGPRRSVLRPSELEDAELARFVLAEALTGEFSVLDPSQATTTGLNGATLSLIQRQTGSVVALDEEAGVLIVQPAFETDRWPSAIPAIIDEDVVVRLRRAVRLLNRLLERVDPIHRAPQVALAAALVGGDYLPWRTRAEQERSPQAATMGMGASGDSVVTLSPPTRRRAALAQDAQRLAEDLTARLRRGRTR